jgi:hypothetical protein
MHIFRLVRVVPPPPSTIITAVITIAITTIAIIQEHDPAVIDVIRSATDRGSVTDRGTWGIRASKSMIVVVAVVVAAVDWYHRPIRRNEGHVRGHPQSYSHTKARTEVVHHQRCVAPRARYGMIAAEMATNHLVAAPGSLYHLNRLAICKAIVTLWTSARRRYEGLINFSPRAAQQIGPRSAGV